MSAAIKYNRKNSQRLTSVITSYINSVPVILKDLLMLSTLKIAATPPLRSVADHENVGTSYRMEPCHTVIERGNSAVLYVTVATRSFLEHLQSLPMLK